MPGMRNWFRDGWLVEKSQLCLRDTNARGNRETRVPDTYESRPLRASLEPVHKFDGVARADSISDTGRKMRLRLQRRTEREREREREREIRRAMARFSERTTFHFRATRLARVSRVRKEAGV